MFRAVTPSALSGRAYNDLYETLQSQIHRVMTRCTRVMATLLMPDDADSLFSAFIDGEDPALIVPSIVRGCVACRRGSLERRMLRAVLASCKADRNVDTLLHKLVYTECEDSPHVSDGRMDVEEGRDASAGARDVSVSAGGAVVRA